MPEHRKTLSRMLLVGQREAVARITPGVSAELQPLDHVNRRTRLQVEVGRVPMDRGTPIHVAI